ncbi:ABC transporter permease [Flavihumibacter solisilvae]|jgi:ABC-type lipoprotein release transport system permease subunit|uniref:ABC transporter permease n=1 Tax=Flavihumibacter solisilvae TaxID=1349421 RepID=A0A0C1L0V0_9BACT|nr:ABC transporter permease [Flavihumibacter solisilvae]KIC93642.1 hypothetical protein OI18_15870 [Flavihumibacter solisilvae]
MIYSYIKIAFRNLVRNKAFSFINIAGLTIGMCCTILILLWVHNERSWDKNNSRYADIYHIFCNRNFNGEISTGPDMMYPLAAALKADFPEVQHAVAVNFGETTLFTSGDKKLNRRTITSSPELFDVFTADFIQGSKAALSDPDAVILTESTARALFNQVNVVGQPIRVNNGRDAIVKAVIKDVPRNSTLQYEAVIPYNPSSERVLEASSDWVNCSNRVFLALQPGANTAALEKNILKLVARNAGHENPTTRGSIILHPMSKWRLYEEFNGGLNTGGRIRYVKLFSWVAVIILVIACVNFMNLSTARSEKRAKEVGIRKTLGSERKQLLWQFLTESLLLTIAAFVLAVFAVYAFLPGFSKLLNADILVPLNEPRTWILVGSIIISTGVLAGSYPALYLSGFNPVKVLKGTYLPGRSALLPRKILVTSQFIVSIVLISATLIIYKQIHHVQNRDLGYNPDNLIMVNSSRDLDKNFEAVKNELNATGMVASVTRTSGPVTNLFGFTSGISWAGAPVNTNLVIGFIFADNGLAQTLNTAVIEGRDFRQGDTNTVMFNKEAIRLMGLQQPVGKEITWGSRKKRIVGIIDNMVMTSPYEAPSPLMIAYENKWSGYMDIRLKDKADVRSAVAAIGNVYKQYSSDYPFEYRFVDEAFNEKFATEQLIGKLSVIFSGLAIFVCCLGLFGLVSFSIERRTREIGIRKVLGANVSQLLVLMSKEFLWLVGIAFLVAIPASWWAMSEWLTNFSYRITIQPVIFIVVGGLTLIIALVTVSLNASKAALSNPVKTLRSD